MVWQNGRLRVVLDELTGDGGEPVTGWTEAKLTSFIADHVRKANQQTGPPAAKTASEAAPTAAAAPAVHTQGKGATLEDLAKMISEQVGGSIAEAIKASREAAYEALGKSTKEPFELTPEQHRKGERGARAELGETGKLMASYMGCIARAGGDPERAFRMAKAKGSMVDARVVKALGESTFSAGGALVPVEMAADYIELLYKESAYLLAGPRLADNITRGSLFLPKITGGATPTFVGESTNGTLSQQTTGGVNISLKKLMVLTASSTELIEDASPWAEQMIRDDLAAAAAETVDSVALRGTGASNNPLGMRNWAASANTFAANATVNVANVTADTIKMIRLLRDRKIKLRKCAWFMSPRSWGFLYGARDAQNNLVWQAEMSQGRFSGYPFFVTQNIPDTLGSGSDSEVMFCDMDQQIFATDGRGVQLDASNIAAYHDGSAVQSSFSRDEYVFRLKQRLDVVSRQSGNEVSALTGVTWA